MHPRTRPPQTRPSLVPSPVVGVGQHHTPEPLRAFSQVRARPPLLEPGVANVPPLDGARRAADNFVDVSLRPRGFGVDWSTLLAANRWIGFAL